MLFSQDLKDAPRALRTFTGLDQSEFETLLTSFAMAWHAYVDERPRHKTTRRRRVGGGRKARLASMEETLLFLLVYDKISPLQEVMATMFAMSQGRVNAWIDKLSEVLPMALGHAHCLPERDPQHLEQIVAMGVSVDCIIDGTERRRQRPTDPVQQHDLYSGKKKRIRSKIPSWSMETIAACSP